MHLLDIVVCIGVGRSVESVKFIIDEANVSDVQNPRRSNMESSGKLKRNRFILDVVADAARCDAIFFYWGGGRHAKHWRLIKRFTFT